MKLRAYQRQDVARVREAFETHRRVLYVLPTGAGKTVVAVALMRRWARQGKRVLFLAHRRELIRQAYRQLAEAGVPKKHLGVIMARDHRENPDALIQVASIATLTRRTMPKADVVVVDEAHHAVAGSYMRVAKALPKAQLLGLTATPVRLDGKGLAGTFDVLIQGPSNSELIADGHLAEMQTWTVPDELLPELKTVKACAGDYQLNQLGAAMTKRQLVGGLVEHWKRHAKGQATVVFATTIEHATMIRSAFKRARIRTEHVDMSTPPEERDSILDRLASGETQVITNCAVLLEGWDAPQIKCVMMARPTMSLALYLQMAGRGARPWGDVAPIILDHAGNAVAHGLPQSDREWSLTQTKRKRGGAGQGQAKACPQCQLVLPLGTRGCPCGYEFWTGDPPAEVEGELVEAKERVCAACGDPIYRHNRTGLCKPCVTTRRHHPEMTLEQIAARRAQIENPRCAACEKGIGRHSISGLCHGCSRVRWRNPDLSLDQISTYRSQRSNGFPISGSACAVCGETVSRYSTTGICRGCSVVRGHNPEMTAEQIVEWRTKLASRQCVDCGGKCSRKSLLKSGLCRSCLLRRKRTVGNQAEAAE